MRIDTSLRPEEGEEQVEAAAAAEQRQEEKEEEPVTASGNDSGNENEGAADEPAVGSSDAARVVEMVRALWWCGGREADCDGADGRFSRSFVKPTRLHHSHSTDRAWRSGKSTTRWPPYWRAMT